MKNMVIFASGSGTNAENIARYFAGHPSIRVAALFTNRPAAGAVARMERLGIPAYVFSPEMFADGTPVVRKLAECRADLVVLAGFMSKISAPILRAYAGRIVNIHPALLPKFGGKGMYGRHVHEAVVAAGERESGITIHQVNEQYDAGAILFQAACPLVPEDTPETVAAKVHALEYAHYPRIIESLLLG